MQSSAPNFPMASLFVGNLHPDVTEAILYDLFRSTGMIRSIRVRRNRITRRSLRYACVNFQQPADAKHALDTLTYETVMGRQLRIMWYQRNPTLRDKAIGKIFLNGLEESIDSQDLYDTFSAFGTVLSCKVESDEKGSKGYGYVHFEAPEDAERAIKRINGMLLNDKKVFVGPFKTRKVREPELEVRTEQCTGNNLYINNLEKGIDEMRLRKEFSPFGKVIRVKVVMGRGHSMGFGFVSLSSPEEVTKAIAALNGRILATKPLYVAPARPKEQRRAMRYKQRTTAMRAMPNMELDLSAQPSGSSVAAIPRASIQRVPAQTTGPCPTSAPAAPVRPAIRLLSEESRTTPSLAATPPQQQKQMQEHNIDPCSSQHGTISGYQKKTPPLMTSLTIEDDVNDLALQLEAKLSPPRLRESGKIGFWPCAAPAPSPTGLALEAEDKPLRKDRQTGHSCSYIRAPVWDLKPATPVMASSTLKDEVSDLALQLEAKLSPRHLRESCANFLISNDGRGTGGVENKLEVEPRISEPELHYSARRCPFS